ncbi:MAG: low molecular weight phosphotyrosine protein phosphatase [Betaproteobacteria bacterium]|nr:MAG: low molecular weight phosphotyrosine protein phosphatase [Betaproteobacteria bacterium]
MIRSLVRGILSIGRKPQPRFGVLFVCMANVCRSPTAEAVFRRQVALAQLTGDVHCASAGTHDFYLGSAPDGRARAAAMRRGYDMSRLRARQVSDADFDRFDMILAMDRQNIEVLAQRCPAPHTAKLQLLMQFAKNHQILDVPDPYFGSARGFELVLDMIEDACVALLEHIRTNRLATPGS